MLTLSSAIRILVVSESRLHREGLTLRLSSEPGIQAVGSAATIGQAVSVAAEGEVDVVLLDAEPTRENRAALAAAVMASPGAHFVALVSTDSDEEIVAWAESGATAIVDSRGPTQELKRILEAGMRGELLCSGRIAGALLRRVRAIGGGGRAPEAASRLTRRERDILRLVGRDMSNKEIARHLGLKLATVKNHVHSIFEKLGVSSRAMAVSMSGAIGEHEAPDGVGTGGRRGGAGVPGAAGAARAGAGAPEAGAGAPGAGAAEAGAAEAAGAPPAAGLAPPEAAEPSRPDACDGAPLPGETSEGGP
jgi:two-component system, NarL family, nitrate/nitrite response regulator NarL